MAVAVKDLGQAFDYLPGEFLSLLPTVCETCEGWYIISETLTNLHCSNPRCGSKVGMRIQAICKSVGILGLGESKINKMVESYNITNPMDIFDFQHGMLISDDSNLDASGKIISQIIDVRENEKYLLWEAVKLQNLPRIQTSAQKIFTGYDSIDEAYEDIHDGGIEWIQERLGIGSSGKTSVRSLQVYSTLISYEADVKEGVGYLNIVKASGIPELTVVASDSVGEPFTSKNAFYAECKRLFEGKYHFNFAGSVSKKTDFLIWAGADGTSARYTSKVSKVERYNESGCSIPILTGAQFIEFLESGRELSEGYLFGLEKNSGSSDVEADDLLDEFDGVGLA